MNEYNFRASFSEHDGDNEVHGTFCMICGAETCRCADDIGIMTAMRLLFDTIRSGDLGPQHQARIIAAQKRLYRAQAEARER